MKKLMLGMGYLTWFCCNLAVLYGIGWGAFKLLESESVGSFILHLAFGMVMLMCLIILSVLCLSLVILIFGDGKHVEKLDDVFDKLNI
jgi:uncharacterized membrane protein YhdT